ncbi:MAG: hypothetical protein MUE76_00875 [Syntrophales bacterium]|nr:hypothetical protein [Syntrophales bacterium]
MATVRLICLCTVVLLVGGSLLFSACNASAQDTKTGDILLPQIGTGSVDAYIEALKSDILAHRRRIVEVNMHLSGKEDAAFWPIYSRYDEDMSKLNFERSSILGFYADNYRTLSDEQAKELIRRMNYVDRRKLSIDEKYAREMGKVLPAKTVLRFFQIERQVDRLVALKIMSSFPLVPTESSKSKPGKKAGPEP